MKYILIISLFLISFIANSQKLIQNETDKFTKYHRLKTSNQRLKQGMLFYIRSVTDTVGDNFYFITFFGTVPSPDVVGTDDEMIFLLDNDNTVTIYPTDIQGSELNAGTLMYRHQYKLGESDIKTLSEHNIKSIRRFASRGYVDIDLGKVNQGDIKAAAKLILKELGKLTSK